MSATSRPKPRLLAPEVIQSSAMDCGPAALKCLLDGHGVPVSYGRLREACQTDVDGTSIDTIEVIARDLGLDAEQLLVPADHLLSRAMPYLPALVVVRLPSGVTHFVVAWRRIGPYVQVMDPGTGRRWMRCERFLAETHLHEQVVPAAAWREWAGTSDFTIALTERMRAMKAPDAADRSLARALADEAWRSLAALDAATRATAALVRAGALAKGREASAVLESLTQRAAEAPDGGAVSPGYWTVREVPPAADGTAQLAMRGAVILRVRGLRADRAEAAAGGTAATIAPDLQAALDEAPARPARDLLAFLRRDGVLAPATLLLAMGVAAGAVVLEAVLLRGLLDVGRDLTLVSQRLALMAALVAFGALLVGLELPAAMLALRLGSRLEVRLRAAFLAKVPRLGDRYFQSRLLSDMSERAHAVHRVRQFPDLAAQVARAVFQLAFTVVGLAWLDPHGIPLVVLSAACAVGLPLAFQPILAERDLRMRSHGAALGRWVLDALIGLVCVRTHGAERSVRREHEMLLVEWSRSGHALLRSVVLSEGLQLVTGFGLAAAVLISHAERHGASGVLLVAWWALSLPMLGQEMAVVARQVPAHRNVTLRLMEPLGARETEMPPPGGTDHAAPSDLDMTLEALQGHDKSGRGTAAPAGGGRRSIHSADAGELASSPSKDGLRIELEDVEVLAAGHPILQGVRLVVEAGEHVAVVGASGAGKSSLVGLLLGWHAPARGRVLVDGEPLDAARLERLRRETAWLDPAVQLWNRSLLDNLLYGCEDGAASRLARSIDDADLGRVVERLPDGMQTSLGEGGGLLSGGEGQRVRLGRAFTRGGVRLVVLDEPFRGLDRDHRRELLSRARERWREATIIHVTHDVADAMDLDRVVVVDRGRIVEHGEPRELAARERGAFRRLLDADRELREASWSGDSWRRIRIERGRIVEAASSSSTP